MSLLFNSKRVNVIDAMSTIMRNDGVSLHELANRCDVKEMAMGRRFQRRSDLPISTVARMLNALGYDLAIVPKAAQLPPEAALVDIRDKDQHLRS